MIYSELCEKVQPMLKKLGLPCEDVVIHCLSIDQFPKCTEFLRLIGGGETPQLTKSDVGDKEFYIYMNGGYDFNISYHAKKLNVIELTDELYNFAKDIKFFTKKIQDI